MGEREKGHEWKFLYKFNGLIFSKCKCGEPKGTMWTDKKQHAAHLASLEAQPRMCSCPCHGPVFFGEHTTECQAARDSNHLHTLEAHPSAGQSDVSLRDIDPTVLLHAAGLKHLYDKLVESRKESAELRKELIAANEQIEEFDARLAESRATMREEAAKVCGAHSYANLIMALPADSSALDARDARVREELLGEVLENLKLHIEHLDSCDCKNAELNTYETNDAELENPIEAPCSCGLTDKISALAQRSAEKEKQ